jgi:hypothetical protein
LFISFSRSFVPSQVLPDSNLFYFSVFLSDNGSDNNYDGNWKDSFFRVLYFLRLLREPSLPLSAFNDEEEENNKNTNTNTKNKKILNKDEKRGKINHANFYRKIANYFGISTARSSYEQYELVQSFTESFSTSDTDGDADSLSNEEAEIETITF